MSKYNIAGLYPALYDTYEQKIFMLIAGNNTNATNLKDDAGVKKVA